MKTLYSAALTASAHFSKILVGFVLLKLIAHYHGAEGLGQLGHFMSLLTILSIMAGGGILNGVIKYVAEYRDKPRRLVGFVSAAAGYSLIFSVVFLILGVFLAKPVAGIIFGDTERFPYVIVLAIAQFGFAYTSLVIGVSNGLGETHVYAKIQIVGSLLAIPVAWGLVATFGLGGAVLGLISSLLLTVLPALYFGLKAKITRCISVSWRSGDDCRRLFSFTLMLITSAIAFPLVEIIVRQYLIETSGYHEAGIWQAAIRLSSAYIGLFSVFLAYCFMPIISAEASWVNVRKKVFRFVLYVMLVFQVGAMFFYIARDILIPFLLSDEFLPLQDLLVYQLVGDFFKVLCLVIGYVVVAKAATRIYIFSEIAQACFFLGIIYFFSMRGVKGVMIGYMISNFVYFFWCIFVFFVWLRRERFVDLK